MWLKDDGKSGPGQRYRCRACDSTRTDRSGTPFARSRWPREGIMLAVRWYGRFRLSLRNVCALLTERGVDVAPSTVMRWVHPVGPLRAAERRRRARPRRPAHPPTQLNATISTTQPQADSPMGYPQLITLG